MSEFAGHLAASAFATYPVADAYFSPFDLPTEDVLDGDPRTEVAVLYEAPDGSVLVGVSRFTQGTYRYHQTANEINYVTAGRMSITSSADGSTIECVAGSVTRLDAGVTYTKTITEPYEEIFVMLNDKGVQM